MSASVTAAFLALVRRSALAALLVVAAGYAGAAELTFDLAVAQGRVADNLRLIRVAEGDLVRLRWTTDRPLVVHLHGYDIEKRLVSDRPTELTFTAKLTGRFPLHVHAAGQGGAASGHDETPLVVIEVFPR